MTSRPQKGHRQFLYDVTCYFCMTERYTLILVKCRVPSQLPHTGARLIYSAAQTHNTEGGKEKRPAFTQ